MGKTDHEKKQVRQTKLVYVAPSAVRLDDLHTGTGACSSGSGYNGGACGSGAYAGGSCGNDGSIAGGACGGGGQPNGT